MKTTEYTDVNLPLTNGQVEKLKREAKKGSPFSIRINAKMIGESGTMPMGLTNTQINKLEKAKSKGVGVVINISKTQLDNMRKSGSGFFSALSSMMNSIDLQKKILDEALAKPIRKGLTGKGIEGTGRSRSEPIGEGGRSMVEEVSIDSAGDLIDRLQMRGDGELSGVRTYEVPKVSKKKTQGKGLWNQGTQQY